MSAANARVKLMIWSKHVYDRHSAARERLREEMRDAIRRDRQRGVGGGGPNGFSDTPMLTPDSPKRKGPEFQIFAPPYPDKPVKPVIVSPPPTDSSGKSGLSPDGILSFKAMLAHAPSVIDGYWQGQGSEAPGHGHSRHSTGTGVGEGFSTRGTVFSGLLVTDTAYFRCFHAIITCYFPCRMILALRIVAWRTHFYARRTCWLLHLRQRSTQGRHRRTVM